MTCLHQLFFIPSYAYRTRDIIELSLNLDAINERTNVNISREKSIRASGLNQRFIVLRHQ
ncbi:hypothetical protein Bhyg_05406 [Pseudolycoriella hygida]|uniref:Uncharacterized protein n=1 Tax=Pseudolycoriella hygida TaxID=35572 RepID=A0A9Q0NHX4_9DIPT|nr:hypothetical protein Bhyg_05406 [Pseudolycoriella hygida]